MQPNGPENRSTEFDAELLVIYSKRSPARPERTSIVGKT